MMTDQSNREGDERDIFPIVALCASAGGLGAFRTFFKRMPTGSGMAFIVVQHQHEQQESILNSIIQRDTSIPVVAITDEMTIQPDRIHVLPSGYDVSIWNGKFQLSELERSEGWPDTIDRFLRSLANDQEARVTAIILSGVGSDGTEGVRQVRANGGLVIAQELKSALQDGMPDNVIQAGLADRVLPPAEMPDYLLNALDIDPEQTAPSVSLAETISEDDLDQLIRQLQRQSGRDFTDYKTSTMRRQIARRMSTTQMNSVSAYLDYMQQHPEEADHLARYLLINVTNFFRDPEAFESLKENALLPTLRRLDPDDGFRAWVPGCATGEEAVSLAILLHECLRELDIPDMEIRIFATDANRGLVERARSGFYPRSIADHVSDARLRGHFVEEEDGYRVRNHISRMLIWSEQNLVEHPPFSKLHLISCRNVLIYFQKRLQDRIFSLFQFALREGGILFLGTSETMPFPVDEFEPIDSRHKVYRKTGNGSGTWLQLDQPLFKKIPDFSEKPMPPQQPSRHSDGSRELEVTRDMLIEQCSLTSMIVDDSYQVRYTFGEIDHYLRFATGVHTQRSVLEFAREGLDIDLTIALHDAFTQDDGVIVRQGVWVKTNGHERIINLVVKPIRDSQLGNRLKMVIFEVVMEGQDLRSPEEIAQADPENDEANSTNARLRQELRQTQEVLQSTTQALQAKSEELTTSMEEIRSANEEAQTTNEELRTSKEELESMNEELNTLNTQLTDQNYELTRTKNTMNNFLQSTEIGMIFLDQDLHIREYTSAVTDIFGLRHGDVGRPLSEIAVQIDGQDLIADAGQVLETLDSVEREVKTRDDRWYDLRIRPYRTTSNVIDGLVLTFSDITTRKATRAYLREVIDTIENSLIELDRDLRVVNGNQSFYEMFGVQEEATVGRLLYDLGNGQWNIPDLRRLLTEVIPAQRIVRDYEVTHDFPDLGVRTMRLNARQIDTVDRILLVITDVSE